MNTDKKLVGKHIVITGGARGIGLAIAELFSKEGAVLSLLDTSLENLEKAQQHLSAEHKNIYIYQTDISNKENVDAVINLAEKNMLIDVLINNAGIASETPFLEISEREWKKIIDVNLTGYFLVSQAVCKLMAKRKKGVVVNMSSKNGMDGEFGYAHYNASKAGIIMLTKTMAIELAHLGIRVNAVCPGYIQTPMSMEIDSPEFTKNFVDRYIPMNRPGNVDEIAKVFLFLASDDSSFITGQTIVADGGQLSGQKAGNSLLEKIN
jgi:3-oxoacyl-[acyl-carrier protein] reductase